MTFFYERFFPVKRAKKGGFKHRVVIGIGGNEGDVKKRFKKLFFYMQKCSLIYVEETSPILKNPPFGYINQDDFYNAVMVVRTSLAPKAFLKFLLHVEKVFKRKRSFKNAPRTLDLDIIFFDNIKLNSKELQIPHKSWFERDSVVLPLLKLKRKI